MICAISPPISHRNCVADVHNDLFGQFQEQNNLDPSKDWPWLAAFCHPPTTLDQSNRTRTLRQSSFLEDSTFCPLISAPPVRCRQANPGKIGTSNPQNDSDLQLQALLCLTCNKLKIKWESQSIDFCNLRTWLIEDCCWKYEQVFLQCRLSLQAQFALDATRRSRTLTTSFWMQSVHRANHCRIWRTTVPWGWGSHYPRH